MTYDQAVRAAFPELEEIAEDALRRRVVDVWVRALEETDYDDVGAIPWWPPLEAHLEGPSVSTVEHVRAVTGLAIELADGVATSVGAAVERDVVVAGALLHDCSKLYELEGETTGELQEWLPHPHYGVHVLADAGCSLHLQHIALSHSRSSAVEPATLEARIVQRADELAMESLFWDRNGALGP